MATSYNLNITQGSEFYVRFQAKDADGDPINLSGYSMSGVVKRRYSDTGIIVSLAPSGVTPTGITGGFFDVKLLASQTSGLPIIRGVYDIEYSQDNFADKLVKGDVFIYPETTTNVS
jgi:hypothetical protein|tara:strand:- start:842 stop:1192 length:351 start_codon:yes stop_codon:yes gene_type:complete